LPAPDLFSFEIDMAQVVFKLTPMQRAYYTIGTLLLITAILFWGKVVLVPLALAILLAFVLTPLVSWLEGHRLHRALAVTLSALLACAVLVGIVTITGVEVGHLADTMKQANTQKILAEKVGPIAQVFDELQKTLEQFGQTDKNVTRIIAESPRSPMHWLPTLAGSVIEMAAQVFLVVVLTVFMLFQRENLRDRVIRLIGRRYLTSTTKAMSDAAERVSSYLLLQLGTNAAMGACVAIGLYLIGVPYAALWGVLVLTLRFVPYAGIWVAAALPFALSIAISPTWAEPLLVLGLYLGLELVVANFVEPLVFGHGTGVSALALLVAAAFWAALWGPIGLLLAAPLTVCLIVMGKHVPGLKFLEVLLSDAPALGPAARYYQRLLAGDRDEANLLIEEHMRDHPPEAVPDEVLLPALVRAQSDRSAGEITSEEEKFIFEATGELLDDFLAHVGPVNLEAGGEKPPSVGGREGPDRLDVRVVGCPARDEADRLALRMLEQVLQPLGADVEVVPPRVLLGEARGAEPRRPPDVIVIADLPPGGLTEARQLCRRLRARYPEARILVGRWGEPDDVEGAREHLKAAGADAVAVSLLETRRQLLELTPGNEPEGKEKRKEHVGAAHG
jgi:predicted PurR-regulated permease PerM